MLYAQHTKLHLATIPIITGVLQDFLCSQELFFLFTVWCSGRSRAHWLLSLLPFHSCSSHFLLHWHCRGCWCSRRHSCCPLWNLDSLLDMMPHSPCWWCWRTLWPLERRQDHYSKDSMKYYPSQGLWSYKLNDFPCKQNFLVLRKKNKEGHLYMLFIISCA